MLTYHHAFILLLLFGCARNLVHSKQQMVLVGWNERKGNFDFLIQSAFLFVVLYRCEDGSNKLWLGRSAVYNLQSLE